MVAQPYYVAEMDGSTHIKYTDLRDALNEYGERHADRYEEKYDRDGDAAYTHVLVDSWAYGPLLRIEEFSATGESRHPTIGNATAVVILEAGYVPWGFRPEMKGAGEAAGREHTGRWMWYLRPVEDIVEGDFYDIEYAFKKESGKYVRTEDGDLVTFEDEANAEAMRKAADGDVEVVEVTN